MKTQQSIIIWDGSSNIDEENQELNQILRKTNALNQKDHQVHVPSVLTYLQEKVASHEDFIKSGKTPKTKILGPF